MKNIIAILITICFLTSCGPWTAGGGSYIYKKYDPSTNATIEVAVKSTREVGAAIIHFSSNGTVNIEIEGIQPGPDNLAQALRIIDNMVKTSTLLSIP